VAADFLNELRTINYRIIEKFKKKIKIPGITYVNIFVVDL